MAEVTGAAHVTANQKQDEATSRVKAADAPVSVVPPGTIASLKEIASGAPAGGCFVEVGVYRGGTAYHLAEVAERQGREIFLYDTFEGIPYKDATKGDRHNVGDFGDTNYDEVVAAIPYATVIKGLFPDSIIPMPKIAFVHIDADQYYSIVNSVKALEGSMMSGGIIVFDDYGCIAGATAAVKDLYPEERIEITKAGKAMVRY